MRADHADAHTTNKTDIRVLTNLKMFKQDDCCSKNSRDNDIFQSCYLQKFTVSRTTLVKLQNYIKDKENNNLKYQTAIFLPLFFDVCVVVGVIDAMR